MKSEGHIKHKLAQVRYRHLKREIRNGLSRRSLNCVHNGAVEIPGHGEVGVCLKGAGGKSWEGGVCDEAFSDRAAQCPMFERCRSKDQIRDDFDSFLRGADRALIAERYPDMAALLWVLDLDRPEGESVIDDEESGLSIIDPEFELSLKPEAAEAPKEEPPSYVASDDVIIPVEAESAGPPTGKARKRAKKNRRG